MDDIVVSSPGKIILFGEHAVVHGKIAIAGSLDLRTYLHLKKLDTAIVRLVLPDLCIEKEWEITDIVKALKDHKGHPLEPGPAREFEALYEVSSVDPSSLDGKDLAVISFLHLFTAILFENEFLPSIEVHVRSFSPVGAGVGSSAAYSACLASAFLVLRGNIPSYIDNEASGWAEDHRNLINAWTFQSEKVIHGTPSGIDNSASVYGGYLSFQSGDITRLSNAPDLRLLLVNTKQPRSTKALVVGVNRKFEEFPKIMGPVFESTEAVAEKCISILESIAIDPCPAYYEQLQELIRINQNLLSIMGVSHPKIDSVCQTTERFGLYSKLTGAGGGGCVFTVLPPDMPGSDIQELVGELECLGFTCYEMTVGGNGVSQHKPEEWSSLTNEGYDLV